MMARWLFQRRVLYIGDELVSARSTCLHYFVVELLGGWPIQHT